MPNQIGQAYGLTVLSPIKPNAIEDVRRTIHGFGESPFAKIGGKRPTVHTARWVVLDELPNEGGHFHSDHLSSRYLLLDINLDTDARGLDGFLDDMAQAMPDEIASLYGYCVGFGGIAGFRDYIKQCQLETTFFFVDYAADERGKVVHVKEALDARGRFVDLVRSVQDQPPANARSRVEAFLAQFSWSPPPGQMALHAATAPARSLTRQRIELKDVQGNVLRGYKHPFACHLYFHVRNPIDAKAGLRALAAEVDHSGDWGKNKPPSTFNLAFSHAGLRALGVAEETLVGFPIAFRMGMQDRATVLGDTGSSAPSAWEGVWKDGVHVLASVYADNESLLAREIRWVQDAFTGADLVGKQEAALLRDRQGAFTNREHFGFADGFGTTDIESPGLDNTPGSGKLDPASQWTGLAPGELLYGYHDEADELPDAPNPPDLVRNGTFLVYRKLRENVTLFRKYLRQEGAKYPGGEELLAAKMVGRFRDGTPLALSDAPDPALVADPHRNNDFRYADDPDGARCPVGAHIRRARPRDTLGFDGKLTDRRRLQRRGMPYGPPLAPDATEDGAVERGILFMAYNIDIERQFEFIQQQWLNYGNVFRQGNDKDILVGDHDGRGKAVIQSTAGGPPYVCVDLPRFVDVRGGEYFFVPGIAGLRTIAGE
jgi:Dyp-type peroxidase family